MSGHGIKLVWATKLTDNDASDKDQVGSIRFEGGNIYKYAKCLNSAGTQALSIGDVVDYLAAGVGYPGTVCSRKAEAEDIPVAAGALMAAVAGVSGTAEYVWIQIKGLCALNQAVTSGDAGKTAVSSGTAGLLTVTADDTSSRAGVCLTDAGTIFILDCPF